MAGERQNWARWSAVSLIASILWLQTNAQGKATYVIYIAFFSTHLSKSLILTSVAKQRSQLHNVTSIVDVHKHCILLLKNF